MSSLSATSNGPELKPFQQDGIVRIIGNMNAGKGTLLADEMGLGKTVQAIGVINARTDLKRVLIVCPASLKLNWLSEVQTWFQQRGNCWDYGVTDSKRKTFPSNGIVITNYEQMRNVSSKERWDLLVFDEAHYLKNPESIRSKQAIRLAGTAGNKLVLTGTPITGKPIDVWPALKMLDPNEWNPQGANTGFLAYASRYCNGRLVTNAFGSKWDFSGAKNLDELNTRLIKSCMVRRYKKYVLPELPEKFRQIIELPHKETEVKKARVEWEDNERELEELRKRTYVGTDEEKDGAVKRLQSRMAYLRHRAGQMKVPYVIKFIEGVIEESEGKIILFAHHHDVLDKYYEGLRHLGVVRYDGRMSEEDRSLSVKRFQSDHTHGARIFLGGISVAGQGLTLTASSHVMFAESSWLPHENDQCEDRAHRITQMNNVLVQYFVLQHSFDVRMAQSCIKKQSIIRRAVDGIDDGGMIT